MPEPVAGAGTGSRSRNRSRLDRLHNTVQNTGCRAGVVKTCAGQVNVLMLFLVVITDLKRAGLMPGDKNRIYTNIFLHRISAKIFQVYAAVRKQVYRQKAN